MRICLYNTSPPSDAGSSDKIIWCPLSQDIVYILHLFRRHSAESASYQVESVFRQYLSDDAAGDITFFDPERKNAAGKPGPVAFYSQSDTLANSTLCLISGNPRYEYVNFVPSGKAENADLFFERNNVPYRKYSYRQLLKARPRLLVLYNDWTKAAIRIIAHCRWLGIPVVCIQESIINFGDSFRRMQHADHVMIQGAGSSLVLPRKHFYLTGNPRYSGKVTTNRNPEYALVNCNFTYGIHENVRTRWLDDISSALDGAGISYLISQHPRDNGDLGKYKNVIRSSSVGLEEQFGKAGLLITRFSSLIHESLVRGIPVIYYNPHNEKMHYEFGFNSEFLVNVSDKEILREQIAALFKKEISGKTLDIYLSEHCLPAGTNPVDNINSLLAGNEFRKVRFNIKDLVHLIIYQPLILSTAKLIRRLLPQSPEPEN